jgi:hypothetical protein
MTGPNPTDRGKRGTKRDLLVDQKGNPLSVIIITSANTHDMKATTNTLDKMWQLKDHQINKIYVLINDMISWKYKDHLSKEGTCHIFVTE